MNSIPQSPKGAIQCKHGSSPEGFGLYRWRTGKTPSNVFWATSEGGALPRLSRLLLAPHQHISNRYSVLIELEWRLRGFISPSAIFWICHCVYSTRGMATGQCLFRPRTDFQITESRWRCRWRTCQRGLALNYPRRYQCIHPQELGCAASPAQRQIHKQLPSTGQPQLSNQSNHKKPLSRPRAVGDSIRRGGGVLEVSVGIRA